MSRLFRTSAPAVLRLCLSYTFSFPDPNATAGGQTASALLVKATDAQSCLDDKGKPVIRPYTPISPQDQRGTLQLMVKVYEVGVLTTSFRISD